MKNEEVALAWRNGQPAKSGTMKTDGQDIYSYALKIEYTKNGVKIAINFTAAPGGEFYSQTTSRHSSMIMRTADVTVNPTKGAQ